RGTRAPQHGNGEFRPARGAQVSGLLDPPGSRPSHAAPWYHPRACPEDPSLDLLRSADRWTPGTRPGMTSYLIDPLHPAHVGLQRRGERDRAVLRLVFPRDRDQRAPDRQSRAVERVHEARILAALRPVARIHAPRLEVTAHRARGNLPIG